MSRAWSAQRKEAGAQQSKTTCWSVGAAQLTLVPAGTPESGGWTTREVKRIVRGLHGLNIVGADIVEVSPAYDTNAELTTMAAADLAMEFLALMTSKDGPIPASKKGVLNAELKAKLAKAEAAKAASARDEL